jgi:preprotein translocase subunit SecF
MEILRKTNIDFMKYRKFWVVVSLALVAVGIFSVFLHGKLNIGIDFAGGTQVNVQLLERPNVETLREQLEAKGIDAQIQRFGAEEENEIILKTRESENVKEGSQAAITAALDSLYNTDRANRLDLNTTTADELAQFLVTANPDRVAAQDPGAVRAHYQGVAQAAIRKRSADGIFGSWDSLSGVAGVSPAVVDALKRGAYIGKLSIVGVEHVGPQIGEELRKQGFWAVALSFLGMLAYIWVRFELRFGIGAIMACIHDVLVTLGLYALAGYEFNLTTIAAFLTLIGYSVNDTVVIFDRIRENMRKNRREPLITVMNRSINETLSRTILTGGSVLLSLIALLIWGGDVIRGFAFVLTVGILVGTYSSIYVASPFALLWEQMFGREAKVRKAGSPAKAA